MVSEMAELKISQKFYKSFQSNSSKACHLAFDMIAVQIVVVRIGIAEPKLRPAIVASCRNLFKL